MRGWRIWGEMAVCASGQLLPLPLPLLHRLQMQIGGLSFVLVFVMQCTPNRMVAVVWVFKMRDSKLLYTFLMCIKLPYFPIYF